MKRDETVRATTKSFETSSNISDTRTVSLMQIQEDHTPKKKELLEATKKDLYDRLKLHLIQNQLQQIILKQIQQQLVHEVKIGALSSKEALNTYDQKKKEFIRNKYTLV